MQPMTTNVQDVLDVQDVRRMVPNAQPMITNVQLMTANVPFFLDVMIVSTCTICYLMFAVCCLLLAVCYLLLAVCLLLSAICCLLFALCYMRICMTMNLCVCITKNVRPRFRMCGREFECATGGCRRAKSWKVSRTGGTLGSVEPTATLLRYV